MEGGFVEIDHSGDIGIEARGKDLAEMLRNATLGLLSLMCWSRVAGVVERPIRVTSASAEDLVVDWLCEVISAAGVYGELYGDVEMARVGEWYAEGVLRGEKVDPRRHDLRFDVKAATYHRLSVVRSEEEYRARVVFDL